MPEREFYMLCAIHMMERAAELTGKYGLDAKDAKQRIASVAFDYADTMLEEYRRRAEIHNFD